VSDVGILAQAFDRPGDIDFWLFIHIFGGMTIVGALTLSLSSLAAAWRDGSAPLTRLGYRSLLLGALPGYLVSRISSQVLLDKEGLEDADLAWIDIGFMAAEPVFLLVIIATVLSGVAMRRAGRGDAAGPSVGVRVATGLVSFALLAYLVAVWAMTTKPT
jgi:hypothetical protein